MNSMFHLSVRRRIVCVAIGIIVTELISPHKNANRIVDPIPAPTKQIPSGGLQVAHGALNRYFFHHNLPSESYRGNCDEEKNLDYSNDSAYCYWRRYNLNYQSLPFSSSLRLIDRTVTQDLQASNKERFVK